MLYVRTRTPSFGTNILYNVGTVLLYRSSRRNRRRRRKDRWETKRIESKLETIDYFHAYIMSKVHAVAYYHGLRFEIRYARRPSLFSVCPKASAGVRSFVSRGGDAFGRRKRWGFSQRAGSAARTRRTGGRHKQQQANNNKQQRFACFCLPGRFGLQYLVYRYRYRRYCRRQSKAKAGYTYC